MRLKINCIKCLMDRHYGKALAQGDREKAVQYLKEVCRIIGELEPEAPAPILAPRFNAVFDQMFGTTDKYEKIKKRSNDYVMGKIQPISAKIAASDDPMLTAMKYARAGNYIDYAALGDDVSEDTLDELLDKAAEDELDLGEYERLREDLEKAGSLVYITDNAGELVLDRLLIEEMGRQYPELKITLAVRGYPIVNDATVEDAEYVGLDRLVPVIESGSHIAGTYLPDISAELRNALESADVIFAKGQGNFETMSGCGLNVYYLFLCKCELFRKMFGAEQLAGMFVNELRVKMQE